MMQQANRDWVEAIRGSIPNIKAEVLKTLQVHPVAQQYFTGPQLNLLADSAIDHFLENAKSQTHFSQCCEALPQQLPSYVEAINFVNRSRTPQEEILINNSEDVSTYMRYAKQYVNVVNSLRYEHYFFLVRFHKQMKDFCDGKSVNDISNHFASQQMANNSQQQNYQNNLYNNTNNQYFQQQQQQQQYQFHNQMQPQYPNYRQQKEQMMQQQTVQVQQELLKRHTYLREKMVSLCANLQEHEVPVQHDQMSDTTNTKTLHYYTNNDLIAIQPFQLIAIEIHPELTQEKIRQPYLLSNNPPYTLYHHVYYRNPQGDLETDLQSHASPIRLTPSHFKLDPENLLKLRSNHMCLYNRFEQEVKMLFEAYGQTLVGTLECRYIATDPNKLAKVIIQNQHYPKFVLFVGTLREEQQWQDALAHLRTEAVIQPCKVPYPILEHDFEGKSPGSTHAFHKVKNVVVQAIHEEHASATQAIELWLKSSLENNF